MCYVFDPTTRWWKKGLKGLSSTCIGVKPLGPKRSYRLLYKTDVGPRVQPIAVGDPLGCRNARQAYTVESVDATKLTLQDVTLYGGPGRGFFETRRNSTENGEKYERHSCRKRFLQSFADNAFSANTTINTEIQSSSSF